MFLSGKSPLEPSHVFIDHLYNAFGEMSMPVFNCICLLTLKVALNVFNKYRKYIAEVRYDYFWGENKLFFSFPNISKFLKIHIFIMFPPILIFSSELEY